MQHTVCISEQEHTSARIRTGTLLSRGRFNMLPAAEGVLRRLTQAHGGQIAARVLDQLANSTGWLVDTTYASLVRPDPLSGTPERRILPALPYQCCKQRAECRNNFCWRRRARLLARGTVRADLREATACRSCTGWACPRPSSSAAGGIWAWWTLRRPRA